MNSPDAASLAGAVFREARDGDLPAILALLADDPLGKYREMALPADAEIPAAYVRAFEAITADPRQHLIVAEVDGTIAGCLQLSYIPGLTYQGSERAQIEGVRVSGAMRGRGLGKAMMTYAIALARAHGCVLVQLTTDKRRTEAQDFYRQLGFTASHEGMKLKL
jgi:ribosomal protein S18 acetylase RimI-like enzyme